MAAVLPELHDCCRMAFLRRSKSCAVKPPPAWEPILADAPLPQQVITLQVTNPSTNQVAGMMHPSPLVDVAGCKWIAGCVLGNVRMTTLSIIFGMETMHCHGTAQLQQSCMEEGNQVLLCACLQPYSIAPPDLHEQHPAHAAFFNLSLVAADEDRASEYAHPVYCNALEMRLASTYVASAFDGTVKVCQACSSICHLYCQRSMSRAAGRGLCTACDWADQPSKQHAGGWRAAHMVAPVVCPVCTVLCRLICDMRERVQCCGWQASRASTCMRRSPPSTPAACALHPDAIYR